MLARIHLDAIGGVAGDMFVAAVADAFPDAVPGLLAELGKLAAPAGASIGFEAHRDGALAGRRFAVRAHAPHGHHHHAGWRGIREMLDASPLPAPVRRHAIGMFALLADAEARVHGIGVDDVAFHEVGAWDSIVDFVAAAYLVDALAPACWSWSALPLGGGRIDTAHGVLPVPAPATALLLQGMRVIDDGVEGERVTPTGAAILAYLRTLAPAPARALPMRVQACGNGFGTRRLAGVPNLLRCLAYAEDAAEAAQDETIATLAFEVDDQSAEDLAVALDAIRALPGVLELYQAPVYGKKGRLATQVQVLAAAGAADAVAEACFEQTTTLGLRIGEARRRRLARESTLAQGLRVKVARRPSGARTAKAEMDDVARAEGGRDARERRRRDAEAAALKGGDKP